ncbi:hypothetical protein N7453_012174 [Penicillium expansum]|nr:hypothetical protein N7453_012174 [Penicillium expansum]
MPPPNIKRLVLTTAVVFLSLSRALFMELVSKQIKKLLRQQNSDKNRRLMSKLKPSRIRDLDTRMLEKQQKGIGGDDQDQPSGGR